jgi:hypothetical protein
MLVVRDEVLLDHDPVRRHQVFHRMWDPVIPRKFGRDIEVENAELADDFAAFVRQ